MSCTAAWRRCACSARRSRCSAARIATRAPCSSGSWASCTISTPWPRRGWAPSSTADRLTAPLAPRWSWWSGLRPGLSPPPADDRACRHRRPRRGASQREHAPPSGREPDRQRGHPGRARRRRGRSAPRPDRRPGRAGGRRPRYRTAQLRRAWHRAVPGPPLPGRHRRELLGRATPGRRHGSHAWPAHPTGHGPLDTVVNT